MSYTPIINHPVFAAFSPEVRRSIALGAPVSYRMEAFDGQNRIERTGLDADTARRFRNNCEAAFYRVTILDERTGEAVTL